MKWSRKRSNSSSSSINSSSWKKRLQEKWKRNSSSGNHIITAIWANASAKYLLYAIFTNIYIRYNVLKWVILLFSSSLVRSVLILLLNCCCYCYFVFCFLFVYLLFIVGLQYVHTHTHTKYTYRYIYKMPSLLLFYRMHISIKKMCIWWNCMLTL